MNADLERLVVLQALDLELKRLREEIAEAPRRVGRAEAARAQAESALVAVNSSLSTEDTLRRSQELDIASARAKLAKLAKQMESATSEVQIQALEHEIDFTSRAIGELEDAELASMERSDEQARIKSRSEESLAHLTDALAAERSRGVSLVARNDEQVRELELEREVLRRELASTAETLLSSYDRLTKSKGTALSEARDHKCTACQMMVRPQRWNDLVARDPASEFAATIFHCETCGRMLFYDPRRDAPIRWGAGDRLVGSKPSTS